MKHQDDKTLAYFIYTLQLIACFMPFLWLVAIIINYIKVKDVAGTALESHFRWQIRTFWFGLLWFIIGGITAHVLIGFVILFINTLWLIYRAVKGWLYLYEDRQMY